MTLRAQKDENWGEKVEIVSGDMREWKDNGNVKADIIVSELLGSFGDNELSPECLYDAQHLFKVKYNIPIWAVETGPKLGSGNWTHFGQWILCYIVWKFHDFSITQILREINSRDFIAAKTAILTHLEALNFHFL